jgi:hypothetical protein
LQGPPETGLLGYLVLHRKAHFVEAKSALFCSVSSHGFLRPLGFAWEIERIACAAPSCGVFAENAVLKQGAMSRFALSCEHLPSSAHFECWNPDLDAS